MQIQRLSHSHASKQIYTRRHDTRPQYHNIWHYHEEIEFIQINKGSGTVFIGDCIREFSNGDVFLIGSNLPHYWLFDEEYVLDEESKADINVIHFLPNFCGDSFLQLSECQSISNLLQHAKKGLLFRRTDKTIRKFFENLFDYKGIKQVTALLDILDYCASDLSMDVLVSENYAFLNQLDDYDRMNKIMDYIRVSYKNPIKLNDLATEAGMTPNSFCRYFKVKTGKTLLEFLTEIRIATACKQLKESSVSIKEMSFDCGFNNFVSFHKAFKKITGKTPMEYRNWG
ncbi:AraC family transcriptional regulator [Sphingobacterium hungaricum]|uniref:AraC family transcriptional regulator n=1 Tax=Sphingobacterium hungaricum TaxID=2082723 RepID=A0A928UYC2_9SPHI|nr:AraC family transcriptional regulator [Sphingobacterium hungaricum]MBE8714273.1 AraC family transcriptional regulator [Sphingobacterium hungaricum]